MSTADRAAWCWLAWLPGSRVAVVGGRARRRRRVGDRERRRAASTVARSAPWRAGSPASCAMAVPSTVSLTVGARRSSRWRRRRRRRARRRRRRRPTALASAIARRDRHARRVQRRVGQAFVQASAYGDERRFLLRPPLGSSSPPSVAWVVWPARRSPGRCCSPPALGRRRARHRAGAVVRRWFAAAAVAPAVPALARAGPGRARAPRPRRAGRDRSCARAQVGRDPPRASPTPRRPTSPDRAGPRGRGRAPRVAVTVVLAADPAAAARAAPSTSPAFLVARPGPAGRSRRRAARRLAGRLIPVAPSVQPAAMPPPSTCGRSGRRTPRSARARRGAAAPSTSTSTPPSAARSSAGCGAPWALHWTSTSPGTRRVDPATSVTRRPASTSRSASSPTVTTPRGDVDVDDVALRSAAGQPRPRRWPTVTSSTRVDRRRPSSPAVSTTTPARNGMRLAEELLAPAGRGDEADVLAVGLGRGAQPELGGVRAHLGLGRCRRPGTACRRSSRWSSMCTT